MLTYTIHAYSKMMMERSWVREGGAKRNYQKT